MSIFDLFRGFFGVPGGPYGQYGSREPFFDSMTHDEEEEDEDGEGFYPSAFDGSAVRDPFDDVWRFGFSMGPNGVRIHEPAMFGEILREMEEIVSSIGRWDERHGPFGMPSIEPPPHPPSGGSPFTRPGDSQRSLRDFMLKGPDDRPPSSGPEPDNHGPSSASPFHHWSPFPKFGESWRDGLFNSPPHGKREDGDLDSQVSSRGLDQILTPAPSPSPSPSPSQPRTHSFFQSVTVKKVVKPDGSVEETRTVRDGQGNEETTVTRSGGNQDDPRGPGGVLAPGGPGSFSNMQDDLSVFSKFFGGFRG